jgi:hypothetical protein
MADNLDPKQGNPDQQNDGGAAGGAGDGGAAGAGAGAAPAFTWKSRVGEDLSKAPSMQKFTDTPEGLADLSKSYVNLEKMLGHEKVPLPKGPEDTAGRAIFNKAIGVPDAPGGYNLPDAQLPESMANMTFNKDAFAGIVHKYGLTPAQASGLWKEYTNMSGNIYANSKKAFEDNLTKNINALRAEWGDAYAGNIELGDMVIAKFADDQAMGDWLTATLSKSPMGMKFLAKIGAQFSENKIGEFKYQRFALTPDEAALEISKIKGDPNHPYNSEKATQKDHDLAVEHVNRLIAISMGKQA